MTVDRRAAEYPRWGPALVRRVVAIRVMSSISLGVVAAWVPAFGPDRIWAGLILMFGVPFSTVVVHRYSPMDTILVRVTLVDAVWLVIAVMTVPDSYTGAALVGMAMLAFVAVEDTRALYLASGLTVLGLGASGLIYSPPRWMPLLSIYVLLLPLLVFMSTIQRERDRDDRRRTRFRVEHDLLTGLLNRAGLSLAFESRAVTAVIVIDLDGFKDINDTLGHHAGDDLLTLLAERLHLEVGDRGVVARTGGDEFAVAVYTDDFDRMAGDALRACRRRVALGDIDVSIGASVGIAAVSDTHDGHELLRRADLAMYEAKRSQGGVRRWTGATRSASRHRVELSGDVDQAFSAGQFELYFQPIVDMLSGQPVDVEGLLRWAHPVYGLLQPGEFLGLVEGIGRRSTMDRLVFEQSAQMAARLPTWMGVSVNISAGSLLRSSVPIALGDALARHDVAPQRITVEIIEDEMVDDHSTARSVLQALGEMGVGIAIDDFGTGHSSLSRLRRLPVSSLKIDRSFVSAMPTSDDDRAIVRAVSDLGRALDLVIVAEGVEDASIRAHMIECGIIVDRLQGYGIARPMRADALASWVEASVEAQNSAGVVAKELGPNLVLEGNIAHLLEDPIE